MMAAPNRGPSGHQNPTDRTAPIQESAVEGAGMSTSLEDHVAWAVAVSAGRLGPTGSVAGLLPDSYGTRQQRAN